MRTNVPRRMFTRAAYFNGKGERRIRVVTLPLISALIEDSRYSLADPRIAPPPPPRPAPAPKRETSGKAGRPKGTAKPRDEDETDPLIQALLAAENIDDPLPADLDELVRRG